MDLLKLVEERHSVRSYLDKPIESELRDQLQSAAAESNRESGLHIQPVFDEPKAFDSFMAHYGKFSGVKNYIALVGRKGEDEKIGYYGEKLLLFAQGLGLNTCWVAMTYKKVRTAFTVDKGEKLYFVLALGYGATQGVAHEVKAFEQVVTGVQGLPEWFTEGVRTALLAPTAMNQQKFTFSLENGKVRAKAGRGFYTKIDLGIVKYHFELGAGKDRTCWG